MSAMDRAANLARLRDEDFDVLVIGGGATGAGIALDAAARGLRTALVEAGDFASGTSSRSTKLVHGGVRYLERAVTHLDRAQFRLVREALAERATLLGIAPHLVHPLRTVVPAYSLRDAIFYRTGLWMYDRAAGAAGIGRSRYLSRAEMLRAFPGLRRKGLRGGVAYYDGQFDDARMNVTLVASAAAAGAAVVNYAYVTGFARSDGHIRGAAVRDMIGGEAVDVRARCVVNATGPFADTVRRMADPAARPMMKPSRGTHLAFDADWAPHGDALLIPRTPDGRVLFVTPWEGSVIAGTTDEPAPAASTPHPTEAEIDYLFEQLGHWFDPPPGRDDMRSSWAGLRPLIADPEAGGNTAKLVREHHIEVGKGGLVTIAGGKWTTYRLMAEETLDRVVADNDFDARPCSTRERPLLGAEGYSEDLAVTLAERHGLPGDVAAHLAHAYGGRAEELLSLAPAAANARLAEGHPYIEAEVVWAAGREMALTTEDVLARRLRLAFIDRDAANAARPRVEELLANAR